MTRLLREPPGAEREVSGSLERKRGLGRPGRSSPGREREAKICLEENALLPPGMGEWSREDVGGTCSLAEAQALRGRDRSAEKPAVGNELGAGEAGGARGEVLRLRGAWKAYPSPSSLPLLQVHHQVLLPECGGCPTGL